MATVVEHLPLCTHRYALFVSYIGSRYNGSQRLTSREKESNQGTIQEALEWSLESFLPKRRCRLTASSRTDKGVHALMNCYTVPLMDYSLPTESMKRQANVNLIRKHHDIVVNEVLLLPASFHPRRAALSREYIYRIAVLNQKSRSPNLNKMFYPKDMLHMLPITELYKVLPVARFDYEKAMRAIDLFRGEHDFSSFAVNEENVTDRVRNLEVEMSEVPAQISSHQSFPFTIYELHFKSRAFLHNQIRRIVGSILSYAVYGLIRELSDIKYLLDNPSSTNWRPSIVVAEPWGLFLSRINFDESTFEGCIKTYEDKEEEKIERYPPNLEMSDESCKSANCSNE